MKAVACLDAKSFFAVCECVERNLDPFTTALAVVDESRGAGSIVLAITPYLKSLGVASRCRMRDIPRDIDIVFAKPRMKLYMEKSKSVVNTYLDYVSSEDIYVYSIDEVFIDLTKYLKYYNTTSYKMVYALIKRVQESTGIYLSAGIGENMLMAKFAMDIEAKKNKNSIAVWTADDVEKKLWKVNKLSNLWGIGKGMEKRLNDMGITTVRQLANTDVKLLTKHFGKLGQHYYNIANGIDDTDISKDIKYELPKSIGNSQMLHKDVSSDSAQLLIREMLEGILIKLKNGNYVARRIHLFVRYSYSNDIPSFSKSITLSHPTDDLHIFVGVVNEHLTNLEYGDIRQVGVTLGMLEIKEYIQLSLLDDYEVNEKVDNVVVDIKNRFGKAKISYASTLLDESTANYRNKLIGGHNGGEENE